MKREIIINTTNLLKSNLYIDLYVILQIIFENNVELFDMLKVKNSSDFNQTLYVMIESRYLKYTGEDFEKDSEFPDDLDINNFVLMESATKLFKNDEILSRMEDVVVWIQEYREKFKGIKSGSKGDPKACLKKMKLFIKENPKYSKDDIFKATDKYIKETDPTYTMQADYFISKTGIDKIAISKLLVYCESLGEVIEEPKSLNKMI